NEMSQIALRLLLLLMCTAVIATGTVIFQERRNQKRLGREQEKLRISEEEYRIAARQSNKHIARYDIRTKTLYQHKETAALLGTESICRDVPESRIAEGFVAPESIAAYREFYAQMIRGEASGSKDVRMKNAINGEFRWYHGDFTLVYDQDNQPIHGVISFYDVTKQREKEIAYTLWKQSISSLPREKTAIFEYNLSENLQESASGCLNGAELKQINMSFKERVLYWGQNVVCHEYVDLYSSFLNLERLLSDFHRGIREDSLEFKAFPEGAAECRWIKGSIKMAEYPDTGQVKGVLIYEDIHEEKMNHLAIKEEAETDFLTGVFNRKTFMEKMQPLLKGGQGQQHLLMMMDLDHFKQINDSLGHREGDRVLKTLAKGLKREIEETGEGFVGRIGGDEFMICMEAVEEKSVVEKAEALRMLLRIQVTENVYTSGSIGVASYPQDGTDFDTLYANADTALYRAKEKGRNCVAFYSLGEEDGNED
ncbi:MAG: GGDEF domain-containing protein, partial [Anaerovoracaceae bacterium]